MAAPVFSDSPKQSRLALVLSNLHSGHSHNYFID
jgi:hypothetical protein